MKTAAIIILIGGLLITLYTGFDYISKKKILDLVNFEKTMNYHHTTDWSQFIGVVTLAIGGVLLLVAKKAKL